MAIEELKDLGGMEESE
jgi:hypothetical protein